MNSLLRFESLKKNRAPGDRWNIRGPPIVNAVVAKSDSMPIRISTIASIRDVTP